MSTSIWDTLVTRGTSFRVGGVNNKHYGTILNVNHAIKPTTFQDLIYNIKTRIQAHLNYDDIHVEFKGTVLEVSETEWKMFIYDFALNREIYSDMADVGLTVDNMVEIKSILMS